MNIELYIANRLCDLEQSDLSIRLKRQFINPSELNTKDAQKSYTISLPSTPANDEIFRYKNVEETDSKFSLYPDARLYVNGILILEGKFRLSEITRHSYKGNLGVPAPLTAKDVFGEMKMNEAGSWEIKDFKGAETISQINKSVKPNCIFPLVLYGLLPKNSYTAKNSYDSQVRLELNNIPASPNCLEMLRVIFHNSGYKLTGSAFDDEVLKNLYVSYKNPNDYELDWGVGQMSLKGSWGNVITENGKDMMENKFMIASAETICTTNIFDSTNHRFTKKDEGNNIKDSASGLKMVIPMTGLYKIDFAINYTMLNKLASLGAFRTKSGNMEWQSTEIQLVKNRERKLNELTWNNRFDFLGTDFEEEGEKYNSPAIYPQENCVHFIDPAQDKSFVCGFQFGKHVNPKYQNRASSSNCNPMAISGGDSRLSSSLDKRVYSAVNSPTYKQYEGASLVDADLFCVDLKDSETKTKRNSLTEAEGRLQQVVWLEKGDQLELLDLIHYELKQGYNGYRPYAHYEFSHHHIDYELSISPFQHEREWLTVNQEGKSTMPMSWKDNSSFKENIINLIDFLPSDVKINDWIDNFCKAFNLHLTNSGDKVFSLDLKQISLSPSTSLLIDLDKKANVAHCINEPLNLPRIYDLGFTIDNNEHGYMNSIEEKDAEGKPILSNGKKGGGKYYTNSIDNNTINQTSNFSYCWYKAINHGTTSIDLPVISDHEVWANDNVGSRSDYKEMISKSYFGKAQRFWFHAGDKELELQPHWKTNIALVSNTYQGNKTLTLDYEDKPNSIMRQYFMLLTNEKEYTVVECYLTPQEYDCLDKAYIRFNGDLYIVAEADGYDPMGKSKSKLKLIKKM